MGLTIGVVVTAIVFIGIFDYIQRTKNPPLMIFPEGRSTGPQEAPLQIIEFIDFQCPECRLGSLLLKEYQDKYPDTIRLGIKYYPLGELNSSVSAVYAECAARQGKFWPMHDQLINQQNQWRTLVNIKPYLDQLAEKAELDPSALMACINDRKVHAAVLSDQMLGEANFVHSSPTYFVNKKMIVGADSLQKFLEDFLEKTENF